ncbi:MAG: cytochrome c [Flavobacteriaceae bacterium]|jgi:hypothetical protein|nr:cytochrome c [Flavobacteriaceae bacterium]
MKKKIILLTLTVAIFAACGNDSKVNNSTEGQSSENTVAPDTSTYDPKRGEGKYDTVDLNVNPALIEKGEAVYDLKCYACHKLTDEKLVGPGWKGITDRQTPQWIMNFIINPEPMIDKDPELQKQLEICLTRMPNQNLSDDDALGILVFMLKNDGK